MAYAITEYEFWSNPKVREAGKDAVLMYLAGNSYCNQFMTDGLITLAVIPTVANLAFQRNPNKAIESLVNSKLWIKKANGYQVHDYLKHNKSKAEIEDLMNKRSKAGKAGAKSRVSTPESTSDEANEQSNEQSNEQANDERLLGSISISNSNTNSKELKDDSNDSLWILFSDVFQNLTGIKPKPTKPVVEMLERFESAGVTVEEYRNAIKQMGEGGYSCTTMKSPETWVMNNRNRKRGKPVQTPEAQQDKFRKLYEQQKQAAQ